MTILSRPRHPVVADALDLAKTWYTGHTAVGGSPALGHAVKVALALGRHVTDPAPELVAAVLLHDSPEFAPPEVDLDAVLAARFGARVAPVVRALQREHAPLGRPAAPQVATHDRWVLCAGAADKIVSLESVLRRAARAPDPAAYWGARPAFVARLPYLAAFHAAAAPHLPRSMSAELGRLVARAEQATVKSDQPSVSA